MIIEGSLPFPDSVEGGVIVRDNSGNPTGLFSFLYFLKSQIHPPKPAGTFLDNAQELLKQSELTENDLLRRFKVTVRDAHRYGLTSIHDAGLDPVSLAFFKRFMMIFFSSFSKTYNVF